jgi:hypothetical protein
MQDIDCNLLIEPQEDNPDVVSRPLLDGWLRDATHRHRLEHRVGCSEVC